MDIDEIQKKAEKLKAEEQAKEKKKAREKPSKIPQIKAANSRYIFNKIYPYSWNVFIWIFVILTAGIVMIAVRYMNFKDADWLLYAGLAFITAFLVRLIIFQITKLFRYGAYKDWETHLNFPVKGWDSLGKKENFPKTRFWDMNVSFSVQLNQDESEEVKQIVHSALYLLVNDINKSFYTAGKFQEGSWGDPRKKWEFNSELSVSGSADGTTLGHIYLCISENLKSIQSKYGNIQSVDISFSGNIREVKPVEVSID